MSLSPRVSRLLTLTVTIVVVTNLVGFLALRLMFPWMFWSPDKRPATTSTPSANLNLIDVASASPAQRVVQQVMAWEPKRFPAPWLAGDPDPGVPALPSSLTCDPEDDDEVRALTPVVSMSRSWVMAGGPLLTDVTQSVQVSAQAFSAGGGGLAIDRVVSRAEACSGATSRDAPALGVQAAVVSAGSTSALLWRRGDVVMVATVNRVTPEELLPLWQSYDQLLDQALQAVCADPASTVADSRRSPYADRSEFLGLTQNTVVRPPAAVTTPLPLPEPVSPDAPVPSQIPIPGPELSVPTPSLMPTPSPPITPAALPAEREAPTAPAAPTRPPRQVGVGLRVPDPTGPGCGWAFTGTAEPAYDAAEAKRRFTQDLATVRRSLDERWRNWQQEQAQYFISYAYYAEAVNRYAEYVAEVDAITAQWQRVVQVREAYVEELAQWRREAAAYDRFLARQQAAQASYDAAVAACAAATPPPPDPYDPLAPPPTAVPGCPPARPPVLDRQPPNVRPKPVAPDASFPEWNNPGHQVADR